MTINDTGKRIVEEALDAAVAERYVASAKKGGLGLAEAIGELAVVHCVLAGDVASGAGPTQTMVDTLSKVLAETLLIDFEETLPIFNAGRDRLAVAIAEVVLR